MVKITSQIGVRIQCPLHDFLLQNQNNPSIPTIYSGTQKTGNIAQSPCIQYTHTKFQQRICNIVHSNYKIFICLLTPMYRSITMYNTIYRVWSYGATSLIPLQDMNNIARFTMLSTVIHIQNSLVYLLKYHWDYNDSIVRCKDLTLIPNLIIVLCTEKQIPSLWWNRLEVPILYYVIVVCIFLYLSTQ